MSFKKVKRTLADATYEELTDEQREKVWKLIDGWYQNTDLWDLLELSGLIHTPIEELDEIELSCDNTDHKGEARDIQEVILTDDFDNESCNWCKACRERDAEIIQEQEDEPSCMKCGKIISHEDAIDFEGQCSTCWHERN